MSRDGETSVAAPGSPGSPGSPGYPATRLPGYPATRLPGLAGRGRILTPGIRRPLPLPLPAASAPGPGPGPGPFGVEVPSGSLYDVLCAIDTYVRRLGEVRVGQMGLL
jgi:hypothetical protein